ncbi:hypothetical protein G0Q06_12435 [Puniceicoccales bacterium CK1056]|uniref:Uncharacterized protein n=1 Tax=Oceanipulchritudo coccoides TaxID=2706888 RepID=A0A6B2M637_9BACT|nr:hypothetical protein [Oceanipulchritudo coccoides]NDV63265.1 hypothetical protein [Oceanipulchritudo coccoides]
MGHLILTGLVLLAVGRLVAYTPPVFPYAPAAGQEGSTAIPFDDPEFTGWANAVVSVNFGSDVGDEYKNPAAALGPARESAQDVLVLGRGGSVTLEFVPGIADQDGWDFAVFENAFRDAFLELAYVEVSSDGVHFVRFPNYSLTADPVGAFGDVQATFIEGFGGKYRAGWGTPFDLSILAEAHASALAGEQLFSGEFTNALLQNYPHLDPSQVKYVRIIDVVGDGSNPDCEGFAVYDPYPTIITSGFDLDAVGVLNPASIETISFSDWAIQFGLNPVPGEDPDQDKWNNYMEYMLGGNPLLDTSKPQLEISFSSNGTLIISYWKNLASETVLQLESSIDTITWTRMAIVDEGSPKTIEIRAGLPMGQFERRIEGVVSGRFARFVSEP